MRKGSLQIDFAIGMAFFLLMFAFVLYFLSGYLATAKPSSDIEQKGISTADVILTPGIPNNWESTNNTVRIGITKDIYRIPVLIETDTARRAWPVELEVSFQRLTQRSQIRVTDITGTTIPFYVENITGSIQKAEVVFVTNLNAGRNVFYIYFSDQNVSAANLTGGLNITTSGLHSGCDKKINNSVLTWILCSGWNSTHKAGIQSLKSNSQLVEAAHPNAIDTPIKFGDLDTNGSNFTLTLVEEGQVFAKYKLGYTLNEKNVELYYHFYNGSPIWKVTGKWNADAGVTQMQINTQKIFDVKQDSSESSEQVIPDTLSFNNGNHSMVRNVTNGFSLATTIRSNLTTYSLGWQNSTDLQLAPYINSTSATLTSDYFFIWHSYAIGNMSNASMLFNQPNITILPKEAVQAISIDKLNKLAGISYLSAKQSLDLGQDEFFIRISNSTTEFFSYGSESKKRNVYVKNVKKVMQRQNGEIEFVTVTLGVWR